MKQIISHVICNSALLVGLHDCVTGLFYHGWTHEEGHNGSHFFIFSLFHKLTF
ncbi:hypothetical protein HMPREF9944_01599 [Segatella maculosa OT 289]|uniref:Uncharacterized protein n=1 Tax=Segatella maculosa OT 289 TaxID=999422 RepID=H1HN55_9BACT|nr:hypothetical protein HMPREF9944_01599 [Segatella maculosa OT 289]